MKERVKEIQSIIEEYVEARLYWDEAGLDGGPDAYLVGERMAATRIAELQDRQLKEVALNIRQLNQQLKEIQADLEKGLQARLQLEAQVAELSELLERVDCYEPWMDGGDVRETAISIDTLKDIRRVLSVRPTGLLVKGLVERSKSTY